MLHRRVDQLAALGLSVAILVIAIYSCIDQNFAQTAFENTSLYCLYFCVGNLCISLLCLYRRTEVTSLCCAHFGTTIVVIASAVTITVSCVWFIGLNFAVLDDEAQLVSVSQGFYKFGSPSVVLQAIELDDELTTLETMVPIRPLLFPTLMMPLHYILGYNFQNGLILNALLFCLLLACVGVLALNLANQYVAMAMQLCVAAQPLLLWSAMSGGFDLLALLMLVLAVTAFWIDGRLTNLVSAYFLWNMLLAYSMVRYESPLMSGVIGIFFLLTRKRKGLRRLRPVSVYVLTTFCLFPVLWQHLLSDRTSTRDLQGARFSFEFFVRHCSELSSTLLMAHSPFNSMVSTLGVMGLGAVGIRQIRSTNKLSFLKSSSSILALTCSAALTVLYLSYWAGGVTSPPSGRFFLVFGFALSILSLAAFHFIPLPNQVSTCLAVVFGLTAFGFGLFEVRSNAYFHNSLAPMELQLMNQFIDSNPGRKRLFAYHFPVELTMRGESAVRIGTINREFESFVSMLQHSKVEDIIVFQRVHKKTGKIPQHWFLRPEIVTETIHTYPMGIWEFRILRVTQINVPGK